MALIKDVVQPFVTDLVHAVMPLTPSPLGGGFYNQVAAAFTTTITVAKYNTYGSTTWGYSRANPAMGSTDTAQVVFNGENTRHPSIRYVTSPYGSPVFYVRYDSGGGSPYDNTAAWPQDWIDGITMDGVVYSQSDANYGFFAGSTGSEVYHKWTSPAAAPFVDADIGNDFVVTWNVGS